jgi:hypothetical protein
MNDRFFLKLLLALFAGLIAAEVLVVVLFGLRLELILFCFILTSSSLRAFSAMPSGEFL